MSSAGIALGAFGLGSDPGYGTQIGEFSPGGVAAINASGASNTANITGQYGLQEAQTSAAAQVKAAQAQAAAQEAAAQTAASASEYGSNQQYQLGMNQLGYKQNVFSTLLPTYTGLLSNLENGGPSSSSSGGTSSSAQPAGYASNINQLMGGGNFTGSDASYSGMGMGGAGGGGGGGGQTLGTLYNTIANANVAAPPALPGAPNLPAYQMPTFSPTTLMDPQTGSVISPGLLSQQINSAYANNAQMTATQIRDMQNAMGGAGRGGNSPAALAITGQLQGANIGADANASLQAQNNAAQLNANYAQAINQALLQQGASVYGSQVSGSEGAYGANIAGLTNEYGTQVGGLTSEYGTQVGAQQALQSSAMQALANAYGSQLGLQGTTEQANANIYGTNVGYQQAIKQAQMQQENAILSSLANFANA